MIAKLFLGDYVGYAFKKYRRIQLFSVVSFGRNHIKTNISLYIIRAIEFSSFILLIMLLDTLISRGQCVLFIVLEQSNNQLSY